MRRMKTRKRTTTGVSLAVVCLLLASPLGAGDKKALAETALVAGTVFRDPGFALPGAEVVITVKTPPEGVKPPKPQKTKSDSRGEFVFHVPPVKAEYLVSASASGYGREEKIALVSGGPERVDIYFTLKPVKP